MTEEINVDSVTTVRVLMTKKGVSFELARELADAAATKATEIGVPSVISIVDESGVDKLLYRMDGAGLASVQVAMNKAYTALTTGIATDQFFEIAQAVPALGYGFPGIPRLCAIAGGIPIEYEGSVIGAIGVSGGSLDEDLSVARAALSIL